MKITTNPMAQIIISEKKRRVNKQRRVNSSNKKSFKPKLRDLIKK